MISGFIRKVVVLSLFSIFLTSLAVNAQSYPAPKISLNPEKGLWIESEDGFMGLKLGFRLQQQLLFTQNMEASESLDSEFLIRRGRILFKGYLFDKKLDYFIQLGLDRGNVTLLNAEYRWKPDKHTKISFGQFFPPVGRQFQTISKKLQMVDRSNVTRFFFTDYDLGIAFRRSIPLAESFAFKAALSITHGEGKNISTAPGGWAYTGRLEILPFGMFNAYGDYSESDLFREPVPKLSIGTALYFNKDAYTKYGNDSWDGLSDNISEYYLDAVFKYNGVSIVTEYIHRSTENERLQISPGTEIFSKKVSGEGFYIQGGKFFSKTIEPTFRISILNPDDANQNSLNRFTKQVKYAIGLNNFLLGHSIKFQTQIGIINEDFQNRDSETYVEFLSQFTISF